MTRLLIWCMILLTTIACGQSDAALNQPPSIRYGEDACDECHMLIQDKRFAAAYITEDGQSYRFDDIGDMLMHMHKNNVQNATAWVHDYQSQEWIRADDATFVHTPAIATPMGYGLIAFASSTEAATFAQAHNGRILRFSDLRMLDAEELRIASPPGDD
nr:nitrous oxide reductase accessory protein NosL [Ardenticatena sp.]